MHGCKTWVGDLLHLLDDHINSLEANFSVELAQIQKESIVRIPLDETAHLNISSDEAKITPWVDTCPINIPVHLKISLPLHAFQVPSTYFFNIYSAPICLRRQ